MQPIVLSHQSENKSMIEIDIKKQLENINSNIILLQKRTPWWHALLSGIMSGFGSIVGVVVALSVIGWILNIAGIIPAFRQEANQWKNLIQQAQEQKLPGKSSTNR